MGRFSALFLLDTLGALLERDVHLGIAAPCGSVHCRDDSIDMAVHGRPLRIAKYHNGDFAACEILLVLNVFISGQENVEPSFFSRLQQLAVG
jgi:hypothetical protein